jgi:hypothetical protein
MTTNNLQGICPGGDEEDIVITEAGYYPLPTAEEPVIFAKCRNSSLVSNPCNPNENITFSCDIGYEGRLCSDCWEGYFHMSDSCRECGGYIEWITFSFMVVAILVSNLRQILLEIQRVLL